LTKLQDAQKVCQILLATLYVCQILLATLYAFIICYSLYAIKIMKESSRNS